MQLGALTAVQGSTRGSSLGHTGVCPHRWWVAALGVRNEVVTVADQGSRFGGRRRRENARGGRHHAHKVRVTPEEEAALLARAGRLGVSVPRLLVEAALLDGESLEERSADNEWRHQVLTELLALKRALGASAININQIAKVANATGEVDPSLPAAVDHLRKVTERIRVSLEQWAVRS